MPAQTPTTLQRSAAGAMAGALAGLVLVILMVFDETERLSLLPLGPTVAQAALHLLIAVAIGTAVGRLFRHDDIVGAALASGGMMIGLVWWIIGPLTVVPLLRGTSPTWSLVDATTYLPNLISAILHGSLTGLVFAVLVDRAHRLPGFRSLATGAEPAPAHVVVLGGGFGGVAAAQRLERLALAGTDLTVSLVSPSNYLLFTPMLAEVAGSSLEAQHISAPIRAACPRTRFYRARVSAIDLDERRVELDGGSVDRLDYDHLVFALGSVPNFRDLPGMEEHSFTLKSLDDATKLRNHVITMLE